MVSLIKICSNPPPMCCTTGHIITVYRSLGLSCIGIAQKLLYVGANVNDSRGSHTPGLAGKYRCCC